MTNDNAVAELRRRLCELHVAIGRPTYRRLRDQAELADRRLPTSTAQQLLTGEGRPRWGTVEAFVVTAIEYARYRRPPIVLPDRLGEVKFWRHLYERIDGPRPDGGPEPATTTYVDFVHAVLHDVARSRATRAAGSTVATRAAGSTVATRAAGSAVATRAARSGAVDRSVSCPAPAVVNASERLLLRLGWIYEAVRAGARPDSEQYHRAYHPFTDALWTFRLAVRTELGEPPLTPPALGRVDWSIQERCANCTQSAS